MTKIMLIEDDFDNRELLVECLELEGYEVCAFENGQDALKTIDENSQHDVLLMDLSFPFISAEEFVESFRSKTGNDSTPILILSGKPDIKKVADRIKAYTFLPKPYDLFKLYSEIANAISRSAEAKVA